MPPTKRKGDKDGGVKKRKSPTPQESDPPAPRKKEKESAKKSKAEPPQDAPAAKKSRISEKGIKSDAKDSLATATMPKNKANKSKKDNNAREADGINQLAQSQSIPKETEKAPAHADSQAASQQSSSTAADSLQTATGEPQDYEPQSAEINQQEEMEPNAGLQESVEKSVGDSDSSEGDIPKSKAGNPKGKKEKNPKPLKIDTTKIKVPAAEGDKKSPRPPGTAMDMHPYARGSVIEVLHGVDDKSGDDDWWEEDSDEEIADKSGQSVRLCDIIDRVSVGENKWNYYVHYWDFNRRMDEWSSMDRIVSPPSVGNAKARAIKKEKEREERKKQRLEEKKAEEAIDVLAPRARRRRTSLATPIAGDSAGALDGESDTPRRTRLSRKKITDDVTAVPSNQSEKSGSGRDTPIDLPAPAMAAEKGVVALPTPAGTHSTTVGEHVVHTITAQELDEHEGLDDAALREHEEVTKVKNVAFLELGASQMETWYFSPLPKELLSEKGFAEVLYVCEFSFSMFARKNELQRFQARLPSHARHPPGNEIYRNGNLAMFEVDGFEERMYCQNLCYIAKLFLDHKTLYFDVDPFLFYVLCEVDERGFHPVGYYSKEKYSDVGYNLACILTFPCHQRKGYGRFLIAFSYELTKKEKKVGSPEKPMSDLGQQAYKPYWSSTIVDFLLNEVPDASNMSIMDISKMTSIVAEDIVFTLNQLGLLKIINGVYFIAAEEGLLKTLAKKYPVKEPRVDPSKLHWTPYITDVKRDKFSISSKKPNCESKEITGSGGFP